MAGRTLQQPNVPVRLRLFDAICEQSSALGGTAFRVLVCLWKHTNADLICWPSEERLAELVGKTERTVRRAIRELESTGWITTHESYGESGRQASNVYRLHIPPDTGQTPASAPPDDTRTEASGGPGHDCPGGGGHQRPENSSKENSSKGTPPRGKRGSSRRFTADDFDALNWPDSLNSQEAREALGEWLDYKRTQGKTYRGTSGPQRILNDFAVFGVDVLQNAVNASIRNNWAGLFPPKKQGGNGNGKQRPSDDDPRSNFATLEEYLAER